VVEPPNRRSILYFNLSRIVFLLRFRSSFSLASSAFLLRVLSSSFLAPFHSQTLIHFSYLLNGVRFYFCTICIFVSFAFSFHSSFSSLSVVPFCWVLLFAFCSLYFGSIVFILHWCRLVSIFVFGRFHFYSWFSFVIMWLWFHWFHFLGLVGCVLVSSFWFICVFCISTSSRVSPSSTRGMLSIFLKCLDYLDYSLYAYNAFCIEMVVAYSWMYMLSAYWYWVRGCLIPTIFV